jgi:hypothetical protein
MSRLLHGVSSALAVRPDEARSLAWLALHSLFLGIFIAFFFSTASALFLAHFDAAALPWAYIASSLVGYGAVLVFSRGEKKLARPTLLVATLGFLVALLGTLWAAYVATGNRWVAFAMFVWMGPGLNLASLEFWALATRLFDLRQGKRLFGLAGVGETVSSILGYALVPLLLGFLDGPVYLLPLAAVGLLACILVVRATARRFHGELAPAPEAAKPAPERARLLRDRYFVLTAGMMALFVLANYCIDFSFLSQVRLHFQDSEQIARFIGLFFGFLKVLELVTRTLIVGRVVNSLGLRFGLLLLPAAVAVCALGAAAAGTFAGAGYLLFLSVALAKLVWMVLRKSFFDPSVKLLFQGLPPGERLAFQTRVEGLVQQVSTGAAGLLLLGLTGGGPADALRLFYVLLPLLALWLVLVGRLHREYRARLLETLTAGSAADKAAPAQAGDLLRLREAGREEVAAALAVLARVEPGASSALLEDLLAHGEPAARAAALEHAGNRRELAALRPVERSAASIGSPEVRAAARGALAKLREVDALAAEPGRLAALSRAESAADRELAAAALAWAGAGRNRAVLSELLWDRDADVRRAALVAAGYTRDPRYWPRIAQHLLLPGFRNAAAAAAVAAGEAILPELEAAIGKTADPEARLRILGVYHRIGGVRACACLLDKLASPDRAVRHGALRLLRLGGYRAEPGRVPALRRAIAELAANTAWNAAALVDLDGEPAAAAVCESLAAEMEKSRRRLYLLLSLLYDPRVIELAQQSLERGGSGSTVYAVEILDMLVAPDLKPLVLPVLEDLPAAQRLSRLEKLAPQSRMSVRERLSAVVHRDRARISAWTKACALQAVGELAYGPTPMDLVANLFHPDPMLQEVAARAILLRDRAAYELHTGRLLPEDKDRLDRAVADPAGWETRSILGRTLFLGRTRSFSALSRETLLELAVLAEERRLAPGDQLPARDPAATVYFVAEGQLGGAAEDDVEAADGGPEERPHVVVSSAQDAEPLRALAPTRLVRLDGDRLLELAAARQELLDAVLAGVVASAAAHAAAAASRHTWWRPVVAPSPAPPVGTDTTRRRTAVSRVWNRWTAARAQR